MHAGTYVQVRYPNDGRWVTVAVSDTRVIAARFAADAYWECHNPRGETPTQVRIATAAQLVLEGGEQEICIADAELINGTVRSRL